MSKATFRWKKESLLGKNAQQAVDFVGMEMVANTKRILTRVVYDTPMSDSYRRTGNLRRSYQYKRGNATGKVASGLVGTNVQYAPYVEFGTKNMKARPHLRTAMEMARRKYGR